MAGQERESTPGKIMKNIPIAIDWDLVRQYSEFHKKLMELGVKPKGYNLAPGFGGKRVRVKEVHR